MKKIKVILPHIISWVVALIIAIIANINFVEFDLQERKLFFNNNAPIWLVYVLFFYVCYLLLIPKLLFKKRYLLFVTSVIVFYLGSFVLINRQKTYIFEGFITARIVEVSHDYDMSKEKSEHIIRKMEERLKKIREDKNSINILNPHSTHTSYTLFFLLAVALGASSIRKWQEYKQTQEEVRQRQLEAELSYLKTQINPHFLFNALNSIYSLVISNSADAGDAVLKLSTMLRYMLYDTDKPSVSLRNELDMISDYLALQRLKCTNVTEVTLVATGEIDNKFIPPLILVPFIENAFKYGADNVNSSFIDISVDVKEDFLYFKVENRVVRSDSDLSGGIGIANIKRRLDIIYPEKHLLTTKQDDDIYCVSLQIPFIL